MSMAHGRFRVLAFARFAFPEVFLHDASRSAGLSPPTTFLKDQSDVPRIPPGVRAEGFGCAAPGARYRDRPRAAGVRDPNSAGAVGRRLGRNDSADGGRFEKGAPAATGVPPYGVRRATSPRARRRRIFPIPADASLKPF